MLFVEDNARLAAPVVDRCAASGIAVHVYGASDAALAQLLRLQPDLVLLELWSPAIDGLAICREIRARSNVPIILVGGRHDPELAARALDGGADDFLPRPFDSQELLARIRAHVRRARGAVIHSHERMYAGVLAIDFARRSVERAGTPVALTSTEFAVVAALARHADSPLTREQLLRFVHGSEEEAFDRSIDVVVSRLRGKLELDPRRPDLIKTIRGTGYMLVTADSRALSPRMAMSGSAPGSP